MADPVDDSVAEDDFKREMLFYRQAQVRVSRTAMGAE